MNTFTISDLSRFSGIKQHTIRIWEQRYKALKPQRSAGNTRYYDNSQLRRLLNIASLIPFGYKASELCSMKDEQLFQLVQELQIVPGNQPDEYLISQLVSAGLRFDEEAFESFFTKTLMRYSLRDAYTWIIYPMLNRIGLMWSSNEIPPSSEHFISNLIRQKLFTAINSLPLPKDTAARWLCFLPEDELHEMGLLMAAYLIRQAGHRPIYLGTNVPFSSVVDAAGETNPDVLLTFFVRRDSPEFHAKYILDLASHFREARIFIAADEHTATPFPKKNIKWLKSVSELEQILHTFV